MSAAASVTTLWPVLVAGVVAGYAVAVPVGPVASYLVGLAARGVLTAWRERTASGGETRTDVLTAPRAFARFVAITAINPGTVLFFAVVVTGGALLPDTAAVGRALVAAVFGSTVFLASASWQLALALGGTVLGRVLSGPRGRLGTAVASSGLLVVLAVVMLLG